MAITIDEIEHRFPDSQVTLIKTGSEILFKGLKDALVRKGINFDAYDFQLFSVTNYPWIGTQFFVAVRPHSHPDRIEFSSPQLWPVMDYWTISAELVEWAK